METCGIHNFSIRDLMMSPRPRQFRVALSGVINFAKFREERIGEYSELTAETVWCRAVVH